MSDDILVRLRLAGEQFKREMDSAFATVPQQAEMAGQQAGDGFARGINARATALGAAVGGALVVVNQAIERSLDFAKELNETSTALAFNAETLQGLRHAAADAGVGAEQLETSLSDLHKRINEASGGSREAQQVFVDLGVGFQTLDGRARSTDVVFGELIDRLNAIEDPAERARLGNDLLGDSYARLAPILADGSAGLRQTTADVVAMGAALSAEEIATLEETNAQLERMKDVLSVSVARVVAENADAIIGLANAFGTATTNILDYLSAYEQYYQNNRAEQLLSNPIGAVVGSWYDRLPERESAARPDGQLTQWLGRIQDGEFEMPGAPPRVTATNSRARRGGGARARTSAEDRERAQAIREAERAEEDLQQAVQRTLATQADSARVEEVRKDLGEAAAAAEEARLSFQRQNPLVVYQTVEALTAALGITRALTDAERAHYENLIASADAAESAAAAAAERAVIEREDAARKQDEAAALEKAQRDQKDAADAMRAEQEDAFRDLAGLYEDLFTGGNGNIWKDFKAQGLAIIADLAAQWTLALLSGQSGAGGVAAAMGGGGNNPLATIFNMGGLFGGNPATKPGMGQAGGLSAMTGNVGSLLGLGGKAGSAGVTNPIASAIAAVPGLNVAIAAAAVTHVVGEGLEKLTGLRFDALGGLFGGLAGGFVVGALKGAVKGNATIGADGSALGITDSFGKKKFQDQAISDATGIMDTLAQLADGLGVRLNSSLAAVSIGTRNGKYRVDPTGQGLLKTGQGAIDFGKDQEAAVEYAVRNLIEDGVLGPISQASRNILMAGGDLQEAIEKAVMIEAVPRLLKQRLDPLGAQLDEIDEQFRELAAALQEGGASAEQIAQARKLWQLERDDAIKQIGQASAQLKDFLQSLNAGPNSPLSLRQQQAEAEKALAPYVASIQEARAAQAELDRLRTGGGSAAQIAAAEEAARAAAGAVDQGGFQDAAQTLLGISRQINGSGAGFFADFDRIRALTGGAIGAIDSAAGTPGAGQDPFTQATAQNTADMASMLAQTNQLLVALNDNITGAGTSTSASTWMTQNRFFYAG